MTPLKQHRLVNSPIVYYTSQTGSEEWILFIHAAFADHSMFHEQIDYFKDRYNILTLDLIGHGQSTKTRKGDSIEKMSSWISDILKAQQIDRIHLAGISLGAVIAQDFACQQPESVTSLACFGGYDICRFDPALQKENGSSQMKMVMKGLISIPWFARENKKISAYTPEAQNEFYQMNLKFPKKSFLYLASLKNLINVHPAPARNYPLLIGYGEHDIPAEQAAIEDWHQNEPDSQVILFEGTGHCVNMDSPEKFNSVMEDFWQNA